MVAPDIIEPRNPGPRRPLINIDGSFMRETGKVLRGIGTFIAGGTALYVVNIALSGLVYSTYNTNYNAAMEDLQTAVRSASICVNNIPVGSGSDAYKLQQENSCSVGVGPAVAILNDELQGRHGAARWGLNPIRVALDAGVGPHPYNINVDVRAGTAIVERVR